MQNVFTFVCDQTTTHFSDGELEENAFLILG